MINDLSYNELLKINKALIEKCKINKINIDDIYKNSKAEEESLSDILMHESFDILFKVVFDKSPVGIFIFDHLSNLKTCNEKFADLLGSSKSILINLNINENIKNTQVKYEISKCLTNKNAFYLGEYTSVTANKTSYIKLFLNPLLDNSANVIGGIGIVEDITSQMKYENELLHTKAQQRALLDNLPAIAWFKDLSGRYLAVNQSFSKLCNKSFVDIIGKTDFEIWYSELAEKINQEDLMLISQKKNLNREVKFKNNEGIEHYFEIYKTVVRDSSGKIIGTTGYATDISQKKKSESDLRTEKIYFENLFNNSPEAIVIADINSNVLRINKQFTRLFQFTEDEIVGRNLDELISEDVDIEFAHSITHQIERGENSAFEAIRLKKDRTKLNVMILGVPINLYDGSKVIYGIYQDITKQKEERQELLQSKLKAEESDKLKTNFLANMSHELRTPLNGILGFSEILLTEDLSAEYIEMIESIHQSGNRLLETINSILDISIIESNKLNVNFKEEDIVELINEKLNKFKNKTDEKGIELIFDFNGSAIIHTDRKIFENIVNNLIDNAVKYTKQGQICIKISKERNKEQNYLIMSISDTGIGIDKENFDKIFQYFSQVSEGYTRTYEGTGLGLSITKHYVEILNGSITLESEINTGSCFIVKLPVKEDDIINSEKNIHEIKTSKPLILLVEDEPTNAEYAKLSIRKDYDVEIATNAKDAIRMSAEKKYDLILMDINLGKDMNGIEASKKIRKIPGYLNIPIIAVTANAMAGQKENFLENGLTDYISKPFRRIALLNVIKKNLE